MAITLRFTHDPDDLSGLVETGSSNGYARQPHIGVDPAAEWGDETITWTWIPDEDGNFWIEAEQCYLSWEGMRNFCRRNGIPFVIDVKGEVVE